MPSSLLARKPKAVELEPNRDNSRLGVQAPSRFRMSAERLEARLLPWRFLDTRLSVEGLQGKIQGRVWRVRSRILAVPDPFELEALASILAQDNPTLTKVTI